MADEEFKPRKMTMSNTKQEMLKAYNEVVKQLREKREAQLKPQETIEEKTINKAVEVADSLSMEGIVQQAGSLKAEVGKLLSQLSDKLEGEVSKYRQVKKAVEAKENELQEIYEIEKSASSLAALIEAQHQMRQKTEEDLAAKKEKLNREIETLRAEWEKEKELHEAEIEEWDEGERKRREREKEEYVYAFQRQQQLAKDQFEDEKNKLERETQNRREQMEKEFAEREKAIAASEEEVNQLRHRVSAFPKEMESAVNKAVKEAVERVRLEARNKEDLLKKEFEGQRNVLTTRIEALEKTVNEQNEQLAKLSQQAEKAYSQVQDIAVKAIEGTSHSQSLAQLQQLLAEQTRKPSPEK